MNTGTIKSLQAVRGIAALLVVMHHYKFSLAEKYTSGWFSPILNAGGIGVTVFFILSGFVMIYSSQDKKTSTEFFINRISRIYPAYLFFIIVSFFIGGGMSIFHYADKAHGFITSLLFLPSVVVNAPAYIDFNTPSAVRWTLNYEMFFYLLFGLSLFFKRQSVALLSMFAIILIAIPAASGFIPTADVSGYGYTSIALAFITNPIMYQFITGVIVGLTYKKIDSLLSEPVKKIILIVSVVLVLYFCFYLDFNNHGLKSSGWIMLLFFTAVVLNRGWLDPFIPAVFIYLGEISFSIYLLHNPMMIITEKYLLKTNEGWFVVLVALALTALTSMLSHKYIEVIASRKTKLALTRLLVMRNSRKIE
ncbi:acyltransferase family protein [Cedecea lapagei]|uniref:acyltransferase family protein n=1 Tax=Cedecea lapagei TaxID=158823 RepID=UPI000F825E1A|nr:acyltransferase [Cedecea lapagei]